MNTEDTMMFSVVEMCAGFLIPNRNSDKLAWLNVFTPYFLSWFQLSAVGPAGRTLTSGVQRSFHTAAWLLLIWSGLSEDAGMCSVQSQ